MVIDSEEDLRQLDGPLSRSKKIATFASRFFAPCEPERFSGNVTGEAISRLARDFVQLHFADASCAFLHGSSVRGKLREFSDIDLVVVLPAMSQAEVRRCVWSGFPLDIEILDRPKLLSAFRSARLSRRANIVFNVAEGDLLCQKGNIGLELQVLARRVIEAGPDRLDTSGAQVAYRTVASSILELADNPCLDERFATIMIVQPILMDIYFAGRGSWAPTRKWAVQSAPDFASQLNSALQMAYRYGDVGDLVTLVEELFAPWGNLTWAGLSLS